MTVPPVFDDLKHRIVERADKIATPKMVKRTHEQLPSAVAEAVSPGFKPNKLTKTINRGVALEINNRERAE